MQRTAPMVRLASSENVPISMVSVVETPDFDALYTEHAAYLWRQARALGVSEASVEDVLQEVFLIVHRRLAEFEGRSRLRSWIVGILVRVAANHRRRHRKDRHEPLDELTSSDASPLEAASRREAARVAEAILAELDEAQRTVFVLTEIGGLTAHEIGEIVDASPNTVSSRLRLARAEFERQLVRVRAQDGWRSR
jgi:RNA polymerase sigma-70 factor (ECF subfamily)